MLLKGLLCIEQEIPFQRNCSGELLFVWGDGKNIFGSRPDGSRIEKNLMAIYHTHFQPSPYIQCPGMRLPGVCLTCTSRQKRFFSALTGFEGFAFALRLSWNSSACWRLRAIRSSAVEAAGFGGPGGGPGAVGCGSGVAGLGAELCRQRDAAV